MIMLPHGMSYTRLDRTAIGSMTSDVQIPRNVVQREGIGATAEIRQRLALLARNLTVDCTMLVRVKQGRKVIRSTRGEIVVDAGGFLLLPPGPYDSYNIPDERNDYVAEWIVLDSDLLAAQTEPAPGRPRTVDGPRRIDQSANKAFNTAFDSTRQALGLTNIYSDDICRLRVMEVLAWLREFGLMLAPPQEEFDQVVRTIIRGNLSRNWSAREIALLTGTSEATLRRRLSKLGTSLSEIQTDTRMVHALALIQQTELPINMIALDVGYESASRFAIRFRQRFGCAPSEVRSGLEADLTSNDCKIDRNGTFIARSGTAD
ncbi:helix-turn-helix transcriptional regulator [uncultured Cohaesibacter sp.]|uniref:helix-turn-helix transcriptional regulator n=1 Tax=uncultured Cohaesibacter sp. TaxID=1002546 RepID=UPI0029C7BBFB|nr:helix-turn-helix transcriptional regulator [uncultured Cohaesibacter sp.]